MNQMLNWNMNQVPNWKLVIKNNLVSLVNDEQGQDLIEYTLLLAFVALASAALFISAGGSVNTIWSVANNQLSVAAASATS